MKGTEVFNIAAQSIANNKLRTSLTILGVVVGIFSIIVIMTIVTMLQNSIEDGFSMLNKNTFQIQKYDAMRMHGGRHGVDTRRDLTLEEFYRLHDMLTQAKYIGGEQWQFGKVIKYRSEETNPNIQLAGVTTGAIQTNNWKVAYGRDFRESDIQYSNDVCILGNDVKEKLFPNMDPVGQTS